MVSPRPQPASPWWPWTCPAQAAPPLGHWARSHRVARPGCARGTLATGGGVALGVSGTGEAEGDQRVLLSFPGPLLWPHAENNPEGQMALSSVPGVGAEAAKGQGFSAGRARPLSGTTPWSLAACQGPARHLPLPVSWEALTPHWTLSWSEPLVGGSRSPAPAVLAGVCRQPPEQRPLNDRPEVLGPGGSPTALRQDTHSHPRGGSGLMVTLRGIVHCSEPGTHPAPPSARLCTGGPAPEPQLCTRQPINLMKVLLGDTEKRKKWVEERAG